MTDKSQLTGASNVQVAAERQTDATTVDQATDQAMRLRNVAARIRRDSLDKPEQYLDETAAPHGGE